MQYPKSTITTLVFSIRQFKTTKTEIFNLCKEHCDILRYEFIFTKPCRELNDILEETFDNLITRELIAKPEVSLNIAVISLLFVKSKYSNLSIRNR